MSLVLRWIKVIGVCELSSSGSRYCICHFTCYFLCMRISVCAGIFDSVEEQVVVASGLNEFICVRLDEPHFN